MFGLLQFRAAVADIPNKPEDNDRYYLKWLRGRYICNSCIARQSMGGHPDIYPLTMTHMTGVCTLE